MPVVPVGGGGGRRGRPAMVVLGVVLIVGGIGAALGLAFASSQRYTDGLERLARGPANCVTTLDVAKDATYYFYVETKGEVGDVRGNCPSVGDDFDVEDDHIVVGSDVDDLKGSLVLPIIVGLAGLALGIAALVLGRRRASAPATASGPPPAQPPAGWGGFQPPPPGGQ